jgi:1-phosphofructokinase
MTGPSTRGVIVTVTPNPGLDLTYQLGPAGLAEPVEVHRARTATLEASGKGVNVSRALRSAGRDTVAVLFSGGATGRQLLDLLDGESVRHRAVAQTGATRVNTTLLTEAGPTIKVNAPGSALTHGDCDDLVVALDNELITVGSGSWVLLCGSIPAGSESRQSADPAELVRRVVGSAHAHGCRCAVDTSGAALAAGLAAGADLLAPNAHELAELAGSLAAVRVPGSTGRGQGSGSVATPERAHPGGTAGNATASSARLRTASDIAAAHRCELLVSLGAEGAIWTDGERTVHARGPAVVPVNTAGAGDALLAGWFASEPAGVAQRLATAVRWGAAACLSPTTVRLPAAPPDGDPRIGDAQVREWTRTRAAPS